MGDTFKTSRLEQIRVNKYVLRGFQGFQGELTSLWNNIARRSNEDKLRRTVQDNIRNDKRRGKERRDLQTEVAQDPPLTTISHEAAAGGLSGLLHTELVDEDASDFPVPEHDISVESTDHESSQPAETTIEGLLARVGNDLELAIITDRLSQSAQTLKSLQDQISSTESQLISGSLYQDENPVQLRIQGQSIDSKPEAIIPAAASEVNTLESSSPSSHPSSTKDNVSTSLPVYSNEAPSTETTSTTTGPEIRTETVAEDITPVEPSTPVVDEKTSTTTNHIAP